MVRHGFWLGAALALLGCDPASKSGGAGTATATATASAQATAGVDVKAVCSELAFVSDSDACEECLGDAEDGPCDKEAVAFESCAGDSFERKVGPCLEKCTDACMSGQARCCACSLGCVEQLQPRCLRQAAAQQTCAIAKCESVCKK
jgi:hypothetical protein